MKKKKNARFPICARGYDKEAVESYIALESARIDEAQLEQRNRIKDLQTECENYKAQIAELRGREEQIKLALVTATANANKLTDDVKARYSAELKRLQLFRAKWTNAYEEMKERYHFDKDALNMESVAVSVELELKKFLSKDFSLNMNDCENEMEEHFRKEVERLTSQQINTQRPHKSADELKAKLIECETNNKALGENTSSVAFSLDDALHPTESLEDICKALGLKQNL